jgi:deoxyribonuclease V
VELARQVETVDRLGDVRLVAGVDCGFEDGGATTRAAATILEYPGLDVIESSQARVPTCMPYIPGLLSFRELPAVLKAFEGISHDPQLLLCDGQGIAHPRRFGIACHLGLLLDRPAIGVGKSRLTGSFTEPGWRKGDAEPLCDAGAMIGSVLRTRDRVKPVFVSPGHRLSIETAVRWVLACTTRYRLPEPIRAADHLASHTKKLVGE